MASRALPLLNQNVWIVGGVGVVGRGIARSLLRAGATVIVNSRSPERLRRFESDLGDDAADRLLTVRGSLLPGYAHKTVAQTIGALPLHHVVAHGALRFGSSGYADETHSLSTAGGGLLQLDHEEFGRAATHLAGLHFSAAAELIPRVQFAAAGLADGVGTYTFVTGRGGGHPVPGTKAPAMADLNQYQVWGLASALRHQHLQKINVRELRVQIKVNRTPEARREEPREVPLSTRIGDLCAGMAAHPAEDVHRLVEVADDEVLSALGSGRYSFEEDLENISA